MPFVEHLRRAGTEKLELARLKQPAGDQCGEIVRQRARRVAERLVGQFNLDPETVLPHSDLSRGGGTPPARESATGYNWAPHVRERAGDRLKMTGASPWWSSVDPEARASRPPGRRPCGAPRLSGARRSVWPQRRLRAWTNSSAPSREHTRQASHERRAG